MPKPQMLWYGQNNWHLHSNNIKTYTKFQQQAESQDFTLFFGVSSSRRNPLNKMSSRPCQWSGPWCPSCLGVHTRWAPDPPVPRPSGMLSPTSRDPLTAAGRQQTSRCGYKACRSWGPSVPHGSLATPEELSTHWINTQRHRKRETLIYALD